MNIGPKLEIALEIASREAVRETLIKTVDRLTNELEKTVAVIQTITDEIESLEHLRDNPPPDQEEKE